MKPYLKSVLVLIATVMGPAVFSSQRIAAQNTRDVETPKERLQIQSVDSIRLSQVKKAAAYIPFDAGKIKYNQAILPGQTPELLVNDVEASGGSHPTAPVSYYWEYSTGEMEWDGCYEVEVWHRVPNVTTTYHLPGPVMQATIFRRVATNGYETARTPKLFIYTDYELMDPGEIGGPVEPVEYGSSGFMLSDNESAHTNLYLPGYEMEYQWQYSLDSIRWTNIKPTWTDECGGSMETGQRAWCFYEYPIYQTTYFRRRATIANWIAKSNIFRVDVAFTKELLPGVVGNDQTVVKNQSPDTFVSLIPASADGVEASRISYEWEYSTDSLTWASVAPLYTELCMSADGYDPDYQHYFPLEAKTYFRRRAEIADKVVYSNTITVDVRDPILTAGIVGNSQNIEYGSVPEPFVNIESAYKEENRPLKYVWASSPDQQVWTNLDVNTPTYQAPALFKTTYFKRIAQVGTRTVSSNIITVTVNLFGGLVDEIVYDTLNKICNIRSRTQAVSQQGAVSYQWESLENNVWTEKESWTQKDVSAILNLGTPLILRRRVDDGSGSAYSNVCFVMPCRDMDVNYIATTNLVGINSPEINGENTNVTYYDRLGCPLQSIEVGASTGNKNDIVTPIVYDNMRRNDVIQYLPYEGSGNNGLYIPDPISGQEAFYTGIFGSADAQYAFHKQVYEASPLNRVVAHYKPGLVYMEDDKKIISRYEGNDGDEVRYITVNSDMSLNVHSGFYREHTLYKNTVIDEDGLATTMFSNINGQTLMVQTSSGNEVLTQTYYVYDDMSRLSWVVSPEGSVLLTAGQNIAKDSDFARKYCFVYEFDGSGRTVSKQVPGQEQVLFVYDKGDRLVMKQDGNMRNENKWLIVKYDTLNREIDQGLMVYTGDRAALQAKFDNADVRDLYAADNEKLKEYKYDIYPDTSLFLPVEGVVGRSQMSDNTKNMVTYEWAHTYDPGNEYDNTYCHKFYDRKGRVIQKLIHSHTGGSLRISYKYDFLGKILAEHTICQPTSAMKADTVIVRYCYDNRGRILADTTLFNNGIPAVVHYEYDPLGRITGKRLGADSCVIHENISYDMQGLVLEKDSEKFNMKLRYNDPMYVDTLHSYAGNVMEWEWLQKDGSSEANTYVFSYDRLHRLVNTNQYAWTTKNDRFVEQGIEYDRNGNILKLKRYANGTLSGGFSYSYDGSKLTSVNDTVAYTYDNNGNQVSGGIGNLEYRYNYLNLLKQVRDVKSNSTVSYYYDHNGSKLGVRSGGKGYEYFGSVVYRRDGDALSPESVAFSNGRFVCEVAADGRVNGYPCYFITDHLGSTRVIVDHEGNTLERNDFYPFGKRHSNGDYAVSTNRYRFNGKEKQATGGLGLYDYGARMYDAELGRWLVPDPMAERRYNVSQYNFVQNNPEGRIDPDGLFDYESTHIDEDGKVVAVYDDGDLGVYMHSREELKDFDPKKMSLGKAGAKKIGETEFWDEFISPETGAVMENTRIQVGRSFDPVIRKMNALAQDMNIVKIAKESRNNRVFDIKVLYENVGGLLNGKYATSRSAGNYLAGYNAADRSEIFGMGYLSFDRFQRLAGAIHKDRSLSYIEMGKIVIFGTEYGPAPTYGENMYQYRMSKMGWEDAKRR